MAEGRSRFSDNHKLFTDCPIARPKQRCPPCLEPSFSTAETYSSRESTVLILRAGISRGYALQGGLNDYTTARRTSRARRLGGYLIRRVLFERVGACGGTVVAVSTGLRSVPLGPTQGLRPFGKAQGGEKSGTSLVSFRFPSNKYFG